MYIKHGILRLFLATLIVLLSACATTQSRKDTKKPSNVTGGLSGNQTIEDIIRISSDDEGLSADDLKHVTYQNGEMFVGDVKLEHTQFDYPITINSRVEFWVSYFTGRGRSSFSRYLERSELFIPYIRKILKEQKMPEDLVYLAMIESGFNNHAKSHAKAVGPWQFISATGKRYGLNVNWWVDERRDTYKSTMSAIAYLRDLHEMFNSWELASASYNAGEGKLIKAVKRFGTNDFWAISRTGFLRQETRDYVPKIIAAAIVAKNRTQFGFEPSQVDLSQDEIIAADGERVKIENAKPDEFSKLNQEALETVINESDRETGKAALLVEDGDLESGDDTDEDTEVADRSKKQSSSQESADLATNETPQSIPTPMVSKDGKIMGQEVFEVELKSPASLLKIAEASGLSYHTVRALNPEILRWCTPPLVRNFTIRLPQTVKTKFMNTYFSKSFADKVNFAVVKAKRGDNLLRIARRYGIHVDPMVDLNRYSSKQPLKVGQVVTLPLPRENSATLASLDSQDPPIKSSQSRSKNRRQSKTNKKIQVSKKTQRRVGQATVKVKKISMEQRLKNRTRVQLQDS